MSKERFYEYGRHVAVQFIYRHVVIRNEFYHQSKLHFAIDSNLLLVKKFFHAIK